MSVLNARIEFEPDTRSLKESRDTVEEELDEPETIQFDAPDTDGMDIEPPAVDTPEMPAPEMPVPDGAPDGVADAAGGGGRGGADAGGGAGGAVAGTAAEMGAEAIVGGGQMPGMGGMQKAMQPLQLLKGMSAHLAIIALAAMAISQVIEVFQPILDILGTAVKVALLPLAMVALEHLLPFAVAGLEMALAFNELIQEEGIAVALGSVVVEAIKKLPQYIMQMISLWISLPLVLAGAILKLLSGFFRSIGLDQVADLLDDAAEYLFDMAEFTLELPGEIWGFFKEAISFIPELPGAIWDKVQQLAGMIGDVIPNPGGAIKGAVPGLAAGGVVTSETLARVGEAGPEAVVPLDQFGDLVTVQVSPPDIDLDAVTGELGTIAGILRDILREMESGGPPTNQIDRGAR